MKIAINYENSQNTELSGDGDGDGDGYGNGIGYGEGAAN